MSKKRRHVETVFQTPHRHCVLPSLYLGFLSSQFFLLLYQLVDKGFGNLGEYVTISAVLLFIFCLLNWQTLREQKIICRSGEVEILLWVLRRGRNLAGPGEPQRVFFGYEATVGILPENIARRFLAVVLGGGCPLFVVSAKGADKYYLVLQRRQITAFLDLFEAEKRRRGLAPSSPDVLLKEHERWKEAKRGRQAEAD